MKIIPVKSLRRLDVIAVPGRGERSIGEPQQMDRAVGQPAGQGGASSSALWLVHPRDGAASRSSIICRGT
jgi:hypothetical protein